MAKYEVGVMEVHYAYYTVEASDEADAKDKAHEFISNDGEAEEVVYSHTGLMNEWSVREVLTDD